MLVKTLIEKLQKQNPNAVAVVRAYEDGSVVEAVSNKHAKKMYWKGDSPVADENIPTVIIGVLGDYGIDIVQETYKRLLK